MASFGWKRRIGEKVSRATSRQFEADAADDRGLAGEEDDEGWVLAAKRRKEGLVGGCVEKSRRLKDEGASLAENRRYQTLAGRVPWEPALEGRGAQDGWSSSRRKS
uniref:Uncharacterized protein n=1 Tax=Anser brachyrhynchus TaxID=132585 RepID=A0A8B9BMY0_9AVES